MPLGYLQVETYYPDGVAINEDRLQQEYARNQQREKSVPAMQPLPGTVKEEPPEADLKKVTTKNDGESVVIRRPDHHQF